VSPEFIQILSPAGGLGCCSSTKRSAVLRPGGPSVAKTPALLPGPEAHPCGFPWMPSLLPDKNVSWHFHYLQVRPWQLLKMFPFSVPFHSLLMRGSLYVREVGRRGLKYSVGLGSSYRLMSCSLCCAFTNAHAWVHTYMHTRTQDSAPDTIQAV
jgi:hypothetical protein